MTYPHYIRQKAMQMRTERGMTVGEIAGRLSVARSTIWRWVGHVEITRKPHTTWPESAQAKGNAVMQQNYRARREAAYADGVASWPTLSTDRSFRDFVCLYIAEGYKRRRHTVSIANSDASVIRVAVRWMRQLAARPLSFSVQHHADQNVSELRAYWATELDIAEPQSIRMQLKQNSGQLRARTWRCTHGVMSATVHDTLLRARLQGWIDCLQSEWI